MAANDPFWDALNTGAYDAPGAVVRGSVPPPAPSPNAALAKLMTGIAHVESGGWKNPYAAQGPATKSGDHAYGKYQVMGANIPQWSREVLGRSESPAVFLHDPQAQEAIASAKLGGYLNRYGPQGAASMWFTGRPYAPNARDVTGTSGADYVARATGAPYAQQNSTPQPGAIAAAPLAPQAAGSNPSTNPAQAIFSSIGGPASYPALGGLFNTPAKQRDPNADASAQGALASDFGAGVQPSTAANLAAAIFAGVPQQVNLAQAA